MDKDRITLQDPIKELARLCLLVAVMFILLNNVLGFAVTGIFMPRGMALPAITVILIGLGHAVRRGIIFVIPFSMLIVSALFLIEYAAVKDHAVTYRIYKTVNLVLTAANVLVVAGMLLPAIR